ncbi:MAG: DMT family transporter [Lachnospiraceae bacterium]|nr:DMT family transporter [Lachnospiraceae bacterium]
MEIQYSMKTKVVAALGLLVTTMIWGSGFVVMKNSVDIVPPAYLLALRFTAAAVSMAVLFHKSLRGASREALVCGIILGIFLGTSYLFQTYGLTHTTASKNAFITTLYVIIVPFFHWLINKKRPKIYNLIAAVIAVIGLALLSLQGDKGINYGDFLTLICGVCFALHMVYIDRFTALHDPALLTVVQIAVAAVLFWCVSPVMDGAFSFAVLTDRGLVFGILYLALFSTMLAFLLQNLGQKYLSANTSALLLSMEAVFGALFSVIFLGDVLTERMLAGCALMFLAVLLSELGPGLFGKGRNG